MGSKPSKIGNRISKQNLPSNPTSEPENDQLPSYSSLNTTILEAFSDSATLITETSTPEWRWTNSECITWLTCVFTVTMGLPAHKATELAGDFQGCGRTLWQTSIQTWVDWLGWEIRQTMHSLMRACYEARVRSGILENVIVNQFTKPGMPLGYKYFA